MNFDFFLRLSIVHDEGLLADGHVLISLKCLLASFRMFALRSWFDTLAERWIEIFDARAFLWSRGILVWTVTNRTFPLELFAHLGRVVLASTR